MNITGEGIKTCAYQPARCGAASVNGMFSSQMRKIVTQINSTSARSGNFSSQLLYLTMRLVLCGADIVKVLTAPGQGKAMDDLFGDLATAKRIFATKEVLRHSYIPERLPHREGEIQRLAGIMAAGLREETPSNVLIYGQTGTGKTATVKYVSKQLEEAAQKVGAHCSVVYINGVVFDTAYRVFAYLARIFNRRVPMIGWPTDMVYAEFKSGLDAEQRSLFIILDEVDKLVSKGDNVLYVLSRINSELARARVSLIGISNDLTFADSLDPRIRSSLSEEELIFAPYNADQLRDILNERSVTAFAPSVLEPSVILLCAALAASEDGDARRALALLRVSGEIAERTGADKVSEEHVRLASEKLEMNRLVEVVKTLPFHSKIVLSSVVVLSRERKKRRYTSGEVYLMYRKLCNHLAIDPLTQARVTEFVSELDILGLIETVLVNRGRYGRTKEISLSILEELVQPVLLEDYKLKELSKLKMKTQATL